MLNFHRRFGAGRTAESFLDALDGRRRGVALSRGGRPLEQRLDLAQSLAKLLLGSHSPDCTLFAVKST
jgi:hypothetical protein